MVGEGDDGEAVLRCVNTEEGHLYPEEVSGQVLAHLLAHAEQSTGTTISKAVISVRAHDNTNAECPALSLGNRVQSKRQAACMIAAQVHMTSTPEAALSGPEVMQQQA